MENPDKYVLEDILQKRFRVFQEFEEKTAGLNLVLEWNYYKDQKSWLCKVLNKKKNLCWLSVWSTGFKLTFFFTEKTIDGFYELDIDNDIKTAAKEMKQTGKLLPVVFLVKSSKVLNDALKILKYKMELKH